MKSDFIVLGAELDGLLAAARLVELGRSVQILSMGAGGLHYAPAGVHVLGYGADNSEELVTDPMTAIANLSLDHPYRKVGVVAVQEALDWFAELSAKIGIPVTMQKENVLALTTTGQGVPVFGTTLNLATLDHCKGRTVAIVSFLGMRDFPIELLQSSFEKTDTTIQVAEAQLPSKLVENAALAKSFDGLNDLTAYFLDLKIRLQDGAELVLFPAVMGLRRSVEVLSAAERVLGLPCYEVPTLPSSVPGMRLDLALREHLQMNGVDTIGNFAPDQATSTPAGIWIKDIYGREYSAAAAIVATGGILMGGLEVLSNGQVRETLFGLDVVQTKPLSVTAVDQTLDALHKAGIQSDENLNPRYSQGDAVPNLFVTGQNLAHCNPAYEASADGLSIATGWVAAEKASTYLKGLTNG